MNNQTIAGAAEFFLQKLAFMLPIIKRCVQSTGKGLYFCRNQHSSAALLSVKCLEWQPAEFDGVDVNLDQLGENYSMDKFSVRLKGESTFSNAENNISKVLNYFEVFSCETL